MDELEVAGVECSGRWMELVCGHEEEVIALVPNYSIHDAYDHTV